MWVTSEWEFAEGEEADMVVFSGIEEVDGWEVVHAF
jgi:hypothetical protein